MNKYYLVFIVILIMAVLTRLIYLGSIPLGVTNDEAGYIYSAYSIFKTTRDVSGIYLPLNIQLDNSFSPVYIYTIIPFIAIFKMSAFSGRLPFAILGILTVVCIFFLAKQLTKNKLIPFYSMFALALSAWHIHISRGAFDATFALFFYLSAITIFICTKKKGRIWYSLPFFLLAFYSYHATKVYFIFLIPLLCLIYRNYLIKKRSETSIFILGCIFIILSFVYVAGTQNVNRDSVFLWSNTTDAKITVDWERDRNNAPLILKELFSNKPLYYFRKMRENYLEAFSTNFLFLYGETGGLGGTYGTFYRGVFYLIDLPLVLLGIWKLFHNKDKNKIYLITGLLLISPLPSTFTNDKTYVMRCVMMLPIFTLIIGYGIAELFDRFAKARSSLKLIFISISAIIYLTFFASFIFQYFFRYSIYGAESWFKSSRDLAEYAYSSSHKYERVIIARSGVMFLMQYGFYNNIEPKLIQLAWKQQGVKNVGNVQFITDCLKNKNGDKDNILQPDMGKTLYIVPDTCHNNLKPTKVIRQLGEPLKVLWKIYEI